MICTIPRPMHARISYSPLIQAQEEDQLASPWSVTGSCFYSCSWSPPPPPPPPHNQPHQLIPRTTRKPRLYYASASHRDPPWAIGSGVRSVWTAYAVFPHYSRHHACGTQRQVSSARICQFEAIKQRQGATREKATLTSLYHRESQTCVWEAMARTGFSATNEITPLTRLYRVSILVSCCFSHLSKAILPLLINRFATP